MMPAAAVRPLRQTRPPIARPTDEIENLERAVLWCASYHRLFGARYGREQLPAEGRPLSCGDASRTMESLLLRSRSSRPVVRRCVSQMLASGYVPDPHNFEQFSGLCRQVAGPLADAALADVLMDLRDQGLRECGPAAFETAGTELTLPPGAPREAIAGPTVIMFRGDVFTVRKQVLVPHAFQHVRMVVDPSYWPAFGPFWPTPPVVRWERGGTPSLRKGTVFENFVVTWNTFAAQSFKVHLKVTRRARAGMMRTDYSLINEEDDKLLVDEGYGEARRIGERRGWTLYTGVKTLKFASTLQNLLSPGVMAMFLDSTASTLTRFRPRPRNGSRRR